MSYSIPDQYPDFATSGSPNTDDTGLPVSDGWPDHSAPSAKNVNWLFMYLGKWVRYLKQQVDLISSLVASAITNDSNITGTTVKDALNTIKGKNDIYDEYGVFTDITPDFYKCADINGGTPSSVTPSNLVCDYSRIGNLITVECMAIFDSKFGASDYSIKIVLPTACKASSTHAQHSPVVLADYSGPTFFDGLLRWFAVDTIVVQHYDKTALSDISRIYFTISYRAYGT